MAQLSDFKEIWIVDFEFQISEGGLPDVHCMVAREARSNRLIRAFREELLAADEAPFDVGNDALFVAYYSSAEFGCFLSLGWPLPANTLDLYVEIRRLLAGLNYM